MGANYTVELIDKITGPAKAASSSVDNLKKTIDGLKSKQLKVGVDFFVDKGGRVRDMKGKFLPGIGTDGNPIEKEVKKKQKEIDQWGFLTNKYNKQLSKQAAKKAEAEN